MRMKPTVCRYEHFLSDWYARQCAVLEIDPAVDDRDVSYRKVWEWAIILEALEERNMLAPNRVGIGFAVGQEPLVSVFAQRGVSILATDLPDDDGHWWGSTQHTTGADALHVPSRLSRERFDELVSFRGVNMNDIADLPSGAADFIWSSCAIEHVGSLDLAHKFVLDSMRLLKPGGVAVHTTEINCSSNIDTIGEGDNVIWRRRDIEQLSDALRLIRCGMEVPDFEMGTHPFDLDYDVEPYFSSGRKHIKLQIGPFVSTSFLLIIQRT